MTFFDSLAGAHGRRSRPITKELMLRFSLWRSRRALGQLDDRQLADIGITRTEAAKEANLGVWDVPHTWHDR